MTELILQARPFVRMAAPTVRSIYTRFLGALDSFAADRMRNAVPAQSRKTRQAHRARGSSRQVAIQRRGR